MVFDEKDEFIISQYEDKPFMWDGETKSTPMQRSKFESKLCHDLNRNHWITGQEIWTVTKKIDTDFYEILSSDDDILKDFEEISKSVESDWEMKYEGASAVKTENVLIEDLTWLIDEENTTYKPITGFDTYYLEETPFENHQVTQRDDLDRNRVSESVDDFGIETHRSHTGEATMVKPMDNQKAHEDDLNLKRKVEEVDNLELKIHQPNSKKPRMDEASIADQSVNEVYTQLIEEMKTVEDLENRKARCRILCAQLRSLSLISQNLVLQQMIDVLMQRKRSSKV
ncbi:hypothetical protein QAD02_015016 [Eretmocerus hayati]|uniref:Uncharacterized protein n=1 Tax=Eretmocerus hayati TaxID=131215 RepID=A0ACC2P7G3_9HYME|nr:hypothetical protein QAD02_015016 [Eretmocerus hayati]